MLHSRHIVVADFADGSTRTLYQGADSAAAEKARLAEIAKGEADAVVIFSHPTPLTVRYPAQEKKDAAQRALESERQANAASASKQKAIEDKRAESKRLAAEAKRLETELARKEKTT